MTRSEISCDLVHAVGDEQDPDALGRETAHLREQTVTGLHVQCGRRLVEDEDPRLAHERADDADGLPIRQGELSCRGVQVDPVDEPAERVSGDLPLLRPFELASEQAVGAEPDVVQHRLAGRRQHFLEHDRDPELAHSPRTTPRDRAAVKGELALVWAVHPADDLDERRLARAVFAEQRVHLTGSDLEVRVDERSGRPEAFGHVGEREAVAGCCHAVAPH